MKKMFQKVLMIKHIFSLFFVFDSLLNQHISWKWNILNLKGANIQMSHTLTNQRSPPQS